MEFAVPEDHKIKFLKSEKRENICTLPESWNMKVTVIPSVFGALGTISKDLVKGLEDDRIIKIE